MKRRLALSLGTLAGVLLVGTVGFMLIEGFSLLDALYMTVITVSTTGYREVAPLSEAGRVFTIGLILAGVGALGYSLGTFIDFMVEGHLRGIVEGHRMQTRIGSLSGHYIVAGIGRVGSIVARELAENGAQFVVIDKCPDCVERARAEGWLILAADATEEESLVTAGVRRAAGLITALDTDADNLFVTLSARTLNPDIFIVARSSTESSESKIKTAGANRVMTPSVIGGRRMATMALHPVVSDYLDLVSHGDELEFRLEELEVSSASELVGVSISDAEVRGVTGAYILAIRGADGVMNSNPAPSTVIREQDKLIALGTGEQLAALGRML